MQERPHEREFGNTPHFRQALHYFHEAARHCDQDDRFFLQFAKYIHYNHPTLYLDDEESSWFQRLGFTNSLRELEFKRPEEREAWLAMERDRFMAIINSRSSDHDVNPIGQVTSYLLRSEVTSFPKKETGDNDPPFRFPGSEFVFYAIGANATGSKFWTDLYNDASRCIINAARTGIIPEGLTQQEFRSLLMNTNTLIDRYIDRMSYYGNRIPRVVRETQSLVTDRLSHFKK